MLNKMFSDNLIVFIDKNYYNKQDIFQKDKRFHPSRGINRTMDLWKQELQVLGAGLLLLIYMKVPMGLTLLLSAF